MALQIYAGLSPVEKPDRSGQSTNAIPPLTFLALLPGYYRASAPGILSNAILLIFKDIHLDSQT